MKKVFKEAFNIISSVLKPAVDAIENFYTSVFQPIFDAIKSVTDVFSEIGNVLRKVEDAIAPIKWALDAISCIFEKVVDPVIDEIMSVSCLIQYIT